MHNVLIFVKQNELRHIDQPQRWSDDHGIALTVTRTELAYSLQDIASSISMFNEVDEGTEQTAPEERKPKKLPFNWRLAYNPRCIMLGLAMMSFTSGLSVTYYSIPPLGKSAGKKELPVSNC